MHKKCSKGIWQTRYDAGNSEVHPGIPCGCRGHSLLLCQVCYPGAGLGLEQAVWNGKWLLNSLHHSAGPKGCCLMVESRASGIRNSLHAPSPVSLPVWRQTNFLHFCDLSLLVFKSEMIMMVVIVMPQCVLFFHLKAYLFESKSDREIDLHLPCPCSFHKCL